MKKIIIAIISFFPLFANCQIVSSSCGCSFDDVLTIGNTSNGNAILDDGFGNGLSLTPYGLNGYNPVGIQYGFRFNPLSGIPQLFMLDNLGNNYIYYETSYLTNHDIHVGNPIRDGEMSVDGDGVNPLLTFGSAAGIAPTGLIIFGDDKSGVVSFFTGIGCTTGLLFTINFSQSYNSNVRVITQPANQDCANSWSAAKIFNNCNFNNHFDVYLSTLGTPFPSHTLIQITYIIQK